MSDKLYSKRDKSAEKLNEQDICAIKKELLDMKIKTLFGQVKDFSKFKKLRVKVARIKTGLVED